ncbi:sugar transferase [Phenylobacterium montanum]|uniref:Sugar transferase n=1 Tax=Phenylobacterium montanum TaxID=2823693 RepID=A0A975IU03_9CAUL|nr:sugar transferase [Caulobacter sp. S6]
MRTTGRLCLSQIGSTEVRPTPFPAAEAAGASTTLDLEFLINLVLASALLVFFAPLMLGVAAAVFLQDGGPVIFAHRRVGRGGRMFPCLKFRSMASDAQERLQHLLDSDPAARAEWERDHKLRNDPRITRLGEVLRRSSLDELPQLFNVMRGEMSLVGPRPIVEAEARRYGRRVREYCSVRPGITGLWQVSGRNDTSYRRRIAIDVVYSRRKSVLLDARILVMTVPAVLLRRGSY